MEKTVQIAEDRAQRLQQLAALRGVTENELIEEGLDILFREQARKEALKKDWELWRQWKPKTADAPSQHSPGGYCLRDRNAC